MHGMKKMWIRKENLYPRPFYKQKFKMTIVSLFGMGSVFLFYQFFYLSQISMPNTKLLPKNDQNKHPEQNSDFVPEKRVQIIENKSLTEIRLASMY